MSQALWLLSCYSQMLIHRKFWCMKGACLECMRMVIVLICWNTGAIHGLQLANWRHVPLLQAMCPSVKMHQHIHTLIKLDVEQSLPSTHHIHPNCDCDGLCRYIDKDYYLSVHRTSAPMLKFKQSIAEADWKAEVKGHSYDELDIGFH